MKIFLNAEKIIATFFLLLSASLFLFLSQNRLISPDEGFYLLASKLAFQGKVPYIDFFYPQMPLLPYIYGAWMKLFGVSWTNARTLSAIFTFCIALAMYLRVTIVSNRGFGVLALLLFVPSYYVLAWFVTAQTYALSTGLLLIAYVLRTRIFGIGTRPIAVLCGMLLGLSVCTRLYFAALIPVFIFDIYFVSDDRKHLRSFMIGLVLGILPALALFVISPEQFWFNNLGYHLERSRRGFLENLPHKWTIIKILLSVRKSSQFVGYEFLFLFVCWIVALIKSVIDRKKPDLAIPIAGTLFIVSLLPNPPYIQYFATLIPFLIITGVLLLVELLKSQVKLARFLYVVFCVSGMILVWKTFPVHFERYLRSGKGVPGVSQTGKVSDFRIASLQQVAKAIDQHIEDSGVIISLWPGYLLESKAEPYPGLENQFSYKAARRVKQGRQEHFHVIRRANVAKAIEEKKSDLIVLSNRDANAFFNKQLKTGEWVRLEKIGGVSIYGHEQH